MAQTIELRAGDLRLALRADLGASIAGLWHASEPVLRSVEPGALTGPRDSGCFVLAPYSNRLGGRRFRWKDRDYTTAPNFDAASPHSLHGVAWQRAWQIDDAGTDHATLSYAHRPDAHWPFAFTVHQTLRLEDGALDARLAIVNDEPDLVAPVGLGWHPYFPKRARSRIHLDVAARWNADAAQLPTECVALRGGIDADVAALDLDHCFDGWRGSARIRDERLSLRLASSLGRVVVFTPPAKGHFCVEPVSHVNDAIHHTDPLAQGLVALAPGLQITAAMRIEIEPTRLPAR